MAFINNRDRRGHKFARKPWIFKPLLPWQTKVFKSKKRFRVVVAGRRTGKTALARLLIHLMALQAKKPVTIAVIYPSIKQGKKILWKDLLEDYVNYPLYFNDAHQTDLYIEYKNGSRVYFLGLENAESIRGLKFNLVVMDEFQDEKTLDHLYEIIIPTILTTKDDEANGIEPGKLVIFGTSKGPTAFYDLIKEQKDNPEWQCFRFPTNAINASQYTIAELELMRASVSAISWSREFQCSFESYKGLIYSNFSEDYNIKPLPHGVTPSVVIMGLDFGWNPDPTALVVCGLYNKSWYVIDERKQIEWAVPDLAKTINNMIDQYKVSIVYASPEANQNQSELRKYINGAVVTSGLNSVADGISCLRNLIHSDLIHDVHPNLYFAQSGGGGNANKKEAICTETMKELRTYSYKDNVEEPVNKNDHLMDALRYAIYTYEKKANGGTRFSNQRAY